MLLHDGTRLCDLAVIYNLVVNLEAMGSTVLCKRGNESS